MDLQSLNGKVAIVTGAGSGIGAAAARALAAEGVLVVLAGRRMDRIHVLQAELGPDRALAVPTNVANRQEVDHLIDASLARFGQIDILLANAGQFKQGKVADVDTETLVSIIDANLIGVLRCIKGVLPGMIARKCGDILVTSSISGHQDIDDEAVYSATKHAVQSLVHILRKETAPHGLRVASISPGIVWNEIWGVTDPADIEAGLQAHSGLQSEDIANLMVHILRMPRRITLRDVVALAQGQII